MFLWVSPARAQIYESVGTRAQGMGGAFVAVADDASATWWNPAGLATGALFSAVFEHETAQDPRQAGEVSSQRSAAWRTGLTGVAVAFPALGLSDYHLRVSQIQSIGPTAPASHGREDQRRGPVLLSSFVLQQFGATVGQSMGDHLVLGSTVKLARAAAASTIAAPGIASLDRASRLDGTARSQSDLDLGALAVFGRVRFAAVVKHVTRPTFDLDDGAMSLPRQARIGVAVVSGTARSANPIALALDADLTRTPTAVGDARHAAAGAEMWLAHGRLGARVGTSVSTLGAARPTASAGLSASILTGSGFPLRSSRSGLFVDAQATAGGDRARTGWGFALRVAF